MPIDASQVLRLAVTLDAAAGRVGAQTSRALRLTAAQIQAQAQASAPVDTGNLRASISTRITGDGRAARMSAEIGDTTDYGLFVELGTAAAGPQPFMAPAFDAALPRLAAALGSVVNDVL